MFFILTRGPLGIIDNEYQKNFPLKHCSTKIFIQIHLCNMNVI